MQLLRFTYSNSMPTGVLEYLEQKEKARVLELDPLELEISDDASVVGIAGAIKKMGLDVTHIFLRRSSNASV